MASDGTNRATHGRRRVRFPRALAVAPLLAATLLLAACAGGDEPSSRAASAGSPAPEDQRPRALSDGEVEGASIAVVALSAPADAASADAAPANGEPLRAALLRPSAASVARDIVAIYGRDEAGGWREAARVAIDRAPGEAAATTLRPVALDGGALWVEVSGPAGAAATHRLLAFDGSTLRLLLEGARPFEFVDLDGDGAAEVVVDSGDRDVLCGRCGVVAAAVEVYRPAGAELTPLSLGRVPPAAPAELRAAVERAVELAEADLWRDAAAAIDRALSLAGGNEGVAASGALIHAIAARRLVHAQESPFPLLALVLAGEYEAAVELLRGLAPAAIFDRAGPVVAGTVADGHVDALASALVDYAGRAVAAQRDLAAAYFLRGLGRYLGDGTGTPDVVTVRADVRQAQALLPYDAFYAACSKFLHAIPAPAPGP